MKTKECGDCGGFGTFFGICGKCGSEYHEDYMYCNGTGQIEIEEGDNE